MENSIRRRLFVFFMISGVSGLIYEIVWTNMLCLVFGSTLFAVATVLTVFMTGLALGSYFFGRLADTSKRFNPVSFYGLLELTIGLYALLTPWLFDVIKNIYVVVYRSWGLSDNEFIIVRFCMSFMVLLLPTVLMGGTLPVLSKFFIRDKERVIKESSLLYGLNTLGAFLGVVISGFFLLEYMGARVTIIQSACLNIAVGVLSIILGKRTSVRSFAIHEEVFTKKDFNHGSLRILLLVFLASGFASMVYEVAWTRILSVVLDSSVYAFAIMLATFLVGLALGSIVLGGLIKQKSASFVLFAFLELGIALSAIITIGVFERIPFFFMKMAILTENSFTLLQIIKFIACMAVMFIPTFIMGGIFPVVIKLCSAGIKEIAGSVGRIYAFNTIGCILGSFAAGFLLVPHLGSQGAIVTAVLINFAACIIMLFYVHKWRVAVLTTVLFILVFLPMPRVDRGLIASANSVLLSKYYPGVSSSKELMNRLRRRGKELFYKEGLNATVGVFQIGENIALNINGKIDASIDYDYHADMSTQLVSGYLAMLLSQDPKDVLIIGYGSGLTVRAVSEFPVSRIYCAELERAVIEASRYFRRENKDVLKDNRVKVIYNDARNYLLLADKRFDVIISEPSNPWMSGVARLFTTEHFKLMRDRLNEGGLVCQWFHTYSVSSEDVRMVTRTFINVFPHTSLWMTTAGDMLLIGGRRKFDIDFERFSELFYKYSNVKNDFSRLGINSPVALLADFMLGEDDLNEFSKEAPVNTDDQLLLEYSAARGLIFPLLKFAEINQMITQYKSKEFPDFMRLDGKITHTAQANFDIGNVYLNKGASYFPQAEKYFKEALKINRDFAPAYLGLAKISLRKELILQALSDLKTAVSLAPDLAEAHFELGNLYDHQAMQHEAKEEFGLAYKLEPGNYLFKLGWAIMLYKTGEYDKAVPLLKELLITRPDNLMALDTLATVYVKQENYQDILAVLRRIIDISSGNLKSYLDLAKVYIANRQFKEAIFVLKDALRQFPDSREARFLFSKANSLNLQKTK